MDSEKSDGGQDDPNDIDSNEAGASQVTPEPPKRTKSSYLWLWHQTFQADITAGQGLLDIVRAAKIWKHAAVLQIASRTADGDVPEVLYHPGCRSMFTMKRDLEKLSVTQQSSDETGGEQAIVRKTLHRRQSTITSDACRVYKPICIFCEKERYIKKSNTRESLIRCSDLRSDTTVRKAATDRNDSRLIVVVSRELVAAEGHYHRSCYRDYMCGYSGGISETHQAPLTSDTTDDSDPHYHTVEKHCYDRLFDFIRNVVFEEPQVC